VAVTAGTSRCERDALAEAAFARGVRLRGGACGGAATLGHPSLIVGWLTYLARRRRIGLFGNATGNGGRTGSRRPDEGAVVWPCCGRRNVTESLRIPTLMDCRRGCRSPHRYPLR